MSTVPSEATIEWIAAALSDAGLPHDPRTLEVCPRDGRLAVRLPDDRMAWFALNEEGRASMLKERRVLRLLEAHCSFSAPRVVYEDKSGWDVRLLVPGVVDPPGLRERVHADPVFAHALGSDLGQILAQQHTHIPSIELDGWLPVVPNWPRPRDLPHLPEVVGDRKLLARVGEALRRRAEALRAAEESVLVHADVGLHNIALDRVSHRVVGLFDYEGAAFSDRHHDFAYMIFQKTHEPMLDGAIAEYERATGVQIERDRVRLLNALAAIGFLAFRYGHAPEEAWCGRTLAMDLAWTDAALKGAGL